MADSKLRDLSTDFAVKVTLILVHQKSRIARYDFFYPLRSNGISSPHEVWWISSTPKELYIITL